MTGINFIMPGAKGSDHLPYTIEEFPTGGFWITVETEQGEAAIFISPGFIQTEILPRIGKAITS